MATLTRSFATFADFARAVRFAAEGNPPDPRLVPYAAAPSTVTQEANGADGGYAVPPDFRSIVNDALLSESSLLGRTLRVTTLSNSITVPADASPSWVSMQPNVQPEGTQVGQVKVALQARYARLTRIQATVPLTNELLEDSAGLDAYLRAAIPERLDFKVTDALVNGGTPIVGLLNSPALITQTKEGAQGAGTIVAANLSKMHARLWGPAKSRAVWLAHSSVEAALQQLSLPPGLFSYTAGEPFARLYGAPVLVTEAAQAIGTPGDLILCDPLSILTATRPGATRVDLSTHVWFDLDLSAYRFALRIGAVNLWAGPVTQKNGGGTVSSAVALEAR